MEQPHVMRTALARIMPGQVMITGTVERRLVIAERAESEWIVADLSGRAHNTRVWPAWARAHIALDSPRSWLSSATITAEGVHRLLRPRVLLTALYRPEIFPLPRFPLGISDLARAAREALAGQVQLMDMQLGVTMNRILASIEQDRPDILGVSATFGQHDLLTELLDAMFAAESPPMVLAGGSLTARNERLLLHRYPGLLIARGAGEPTVQDAIAHWHGDIGPAEIRGVGYTNGARTSGTGLLQVARRRTATVGNRAQADPLPELDLLDLTFAHRGVAQLESSRGCTNSCSFCPRGHKGQWSGAAPESFPDILAAMREVFARYPDISRTLFLVDEEFIGGDAGAVSRALDVAATVHQAGFRWESSCRVDQVVDPAQDRAWHIDRAGMWRRLCELGLRRMLFGVESGVTSILERFNKETTAEQNALAIRTLSALGIPTRLTYITFDQLMGRDELAASYAFQGRTDLLLRPLPHLPVEAIVDGVHDEAFVAAHRTGRPLHTGISYMLVSMECLIGAAYTRRVEAAGLAGAVRPSMGRVDADFADWRIGRTSHHAQLWVDRHFPLDYTLKSLEKLLDGESRRQVRGARVVIKDAAYTLLGRMLDRIDRYTIDIPRPDALDADLLAAMAHGLDDLRHRMTSTVGAVAAILPADAAHILRAEYTRWHTPTGWQLINAADPCGT
ncbi:radical SAM protein [Micromonospora sp. NPDC050397]|uniref:radical SAM protein n=1 Tax=Micromonospora sp. NPDC050397 TaxID=3364279 RepID=UPI00384A6733